MRGVIFDLDGTLADTSGDLIDAANACFQAMGHGDRLMHGADMTLALGGARAMLREGLTRIGAPWNETEVDAWYPRLLIAYGESIARHTRLFPGAVEAIHALTEQGIKVAVCTNKPEALARTLLEQLGIADLFGALVGADTLTVRKPDPAPLWAAIDACGAHRDKSLLVGDSRTDRDTARAAGVPCIMVPFGVSGTAATELEPEALIDRFDLLPATALRLLGT